MLTFFHGWRRKTGCVTLVLACAFAGGWIRSLVVADLIGFNSNYLISAGGLFGSIHVDETTHNGLFWEINPNLFGLHSDPYFFWSWSGFVLALSQNKLVWTIPYWSIVIPLTALSAVLLLTKPRQSTPKKTPETIAPKQD